MIADTSVWIDAWRHPEGVCARGLRKFIDQDEVWLPLPVKLELLSGVGTRNYRQLQRQLSALPLLEPSTRSWELVEKWIYQATQKHVRFGILDLLIGALATEKQMPIWSLDGDFIAMNALGFVDIIH